MTVTQMQEDLVLLAYKIEAMKQEQIMLLKNLDVEKRTTEQLKVYRYIYSIPTNYHQLSQVYCIRSDFRGECRVL